MGCSNAKPTLEGAIDELKVNPSTGLVNLQAALEQAGKYSSDQRALEMIKAKVPQIFELLPKAMLGLSVKRPKPVLAACGVIERCVNFCNDPSLGGAQLTIAAATIKQCQSHLVALFKQAQENAASVFREQRLECEPSSKLIKAIAFATVALFMLEGHAGECKEAFTKSGGIAVALKAMQTELSGVTMKAMEALASMLSLFADTPDNVAIVIANGGNFRLIPYVEEPKTYDVSKLMQNHCIAVLEACMTHGHNVKNKDAMQAAIDKGASAWHPSFSMKGSNILSV